MMDRSIPQLFKEKLMQQLVYFDENKSDFLDVYGANMTERNRLIHLIDDYTEAIEHFLNKEEPPLDKVFIGTKVIVKYEGEDFTEELTICMPDESNPGSGYISFLSPVGSQLLLKSAKENIRLKTPGGEMTVEILDIQP